MNAIHKQLFKANITGSEYDPETFRWCYKGGRSSPPPAPDPRETAAAQAAANKESAIAGQELNLINQYTPYGSLEYEQRGTSPSGTPMYSATQTLSPEQQAILDQTLGAQLKYGETANQQLGTVSERLAQPIDYASLGPAPEVNEETRRATQEAILARMAPQQEEDLARLEARLAGQGIGIGSEAYSDAMFDYNRALTDARLAADVAAGDEMSRMYGLESTARNQAINEMLQQRTQPLNELAAMMTGAQVQQPGFVNAPQTAVAPTDVIGATYGAADLDMQRYRADQQRRASQFGALGDLIGTTGGAAIYKWSDRRLKRNIRKIGTYRAYNLYSYDYVWGESSIGVMADEVPASARLTINGYEMVNYGAL